ncbi:MULTISPECIES: UDP-3-O-(3-hydroxymyristoyl)glucosamine N-acyltransferase [Prochlorococcus]|uniref:UDP-3-O-(3-hydroxymyristoyl)glucosamine N-acyltransferase n=1 Tax=Prochlorococcus TaxID=1218 RepID=UPI00053374F9|nr:MULTISPECIES: UDP-3-O-(3-hydroxymyristoyl)glucosamine N-acyltransferase [Prochlorococcus]KGG12372.1 UDP-3-O-(3-hydroxymyristoyl) glucosamine N-acyltransferase [Prochlorococcus sp. MIT 0601]
MLFSKLLKKLRQGDSNILDQNICNDPDILKASSLDKGQVGEISFLEENSYLLKSIFSTNISAILIPNQTKIKDLANEKGIAWASCLDPKLAFAEVLDELNPRMVARPGIHETAVIGSNVDISKEASIGANVFIGDNCKIGEGSLIHPGVVIYNNVIVGSNSELHANCVLHPKTIVGNNCLIHSNAVIGSEGFGFIPTKNGWRKMPQTGNVILEDFVEIGTCSTIDRPSVGETRIGKGTKLDNLVQIGHGVAVGKNCAMASQVGVAGGAKIGDGVILAGQVGVGNRVRIGDGVIASSKCGVHADIEPGQVISGFPAMPNKLWLRCSASFKKLPDIAKSIRNAKDPKSH